MAFAGIIKLNKRGCGLICLLLVILLYFQFRKKLNYISDEEVSLAKLLQVAVRAAEVGGELVVSTRNELKIKSKGKTKEGMDDSVTTADFLSHCAMKNIITSSFPSVSFISEENNVNCEKTIYEHSLRTFVMPDVFVKAKDVTIWIDPLDATHEYTEKLYEYVTTMVCVAVKGHPTIGVIHKPFNVSTSWAVVGYGHSNDLNQMEKNGDTQKIKVIISRSHSGQIREVLTKNFQDIEVVTAAGAGYKALKVATGEVDAYLHTTAIKKWDICAGNAILNALGGKVTTKQGAFLSYKDDTDVVNKDGLIATLKNHDSFIGNL